MRSHSRPRSRAETLWLAIIVTKRILDKVMKTWKRESAPQAMAQRIFRQCEVKVPDLRGKSIVWSVHTPMFWHTWAHRFAVSLIKSRGAQTPSILPRNWRLSATSGIDMLAKCVSAPRVPPGTLRFCPQRVFCVLRLRSDFCDVLVFCRGDGASVSFFFIFEFLKRWL